ncbi:GPI-anchor transamidase domain containing protein [Babesia gibsoni]|uniref:GPI-anchor transamidase domain containing protein n=1 Tax=Babesia gibsoni TaxID=33632 RepID=A0AAD8PFF2_BABGI|nr:GPI-anchor transamidase domain containing protein [Babesia gibsoni]
MLLKLILLYLLRVARCDEYLKGRICAIGPDTFGLLAKYKTALANSPSNETSTIKVADYLQSKDTISQIEVDILTKYKEVQSIIYSTSAFYYNYRHAADVFAFASVLRADGLHSRHNTLVFVTEPCLCHPTNGYPGRIYINKGIDIERYNGEIANDKDNVFTEHMYTAYRSIGLKLDHLRFILTQRFPIKYPRSSRIATKYRVELDSVGEQVDLPSQLIFLAGHGGDGYFQFQTKDTISTRDLELYMSEFYIKNPNVHSLIIIDTCQASTMMEGLNREHPLAWVASSPRSQSSFSYNANSQLTVSTIGKFTYYLVDFLKHVINGIKKRNDRASISRMSMWQLQRHLLRHCSEEKPVFHLNPSIIRNEELLAKSITSKKSQGEENDTEKDASSKHLYLGRFAFNYRIAYLNDYRWPLSIEAKGLQDTDLKYKPYQLLGIENNKILEIERKRLIAKMKECGYLKEPKRELKPWVTVVAILLFILSFGIVILQNKGTARY